MRNRLATVLVLAMTLTAVGSAALSAETGEEPADAEASVLFVLEAGAATADGSRLVLEDVDTDMLEFADRPVREARRIETVDFIADWDATFEGIPPNAAVSWETGDGRADAVVEISEPVLDGERVVFAITPIEVVPDRMEGLIPSGSTVLPESLDEVDLFIDSAKKHGHRLKSGNTVSMTFQYCSATAGGGIHKCATPPSNVMQAIMTMPEGSMLLVAYGGGNQVNLDLATSGTVSGIPSDMSSVDVDYSYTCDGNSQNKTLDQWAVSALDTSAPCGGSGGGGLYPNCGNGGLGDVEAGGVIQCVMGRGG